MYHYYDYDYDCHSHRSLSWCTRKLGIEELSSFVVGPVLGLIYTYTHTTSIRSEKNGTRLITVLLLFFSCFFVIYVCVCVETKTVQCCVFLHPKDIGTFTLCNKKYELLQGVISANYLRLLSWVMNQASRMVRHMRGNHCILYDGPCMKTTHKKHMSCVSLIKS